MVAKLKALKGILKVWNREVFDRVETNKREALRRVKFWDNLEKERELSLRESEERKKARDDFKIQAIMEEASWRQKSRELWLKEGDRNSGFFHRLANAHRRRNFLRNISINGRRCKEEAELKKGLAGAFQNILSDPGGWRPSLPELPFKEVGAEEAARLEEMFTETEVVAVLSGLNGDKAPGPYGFPITFLSFY